MGPGHQSHGPDGAQIALTALRQWLLLPCRTHGSPATVSPPPVSPSCCPLSTASGSYVGRPPPPPPWSVLSSSSACHPQCATISATIEPLHSAAPDPSELPITTPSTVLPCTTFLDQELSITTPRRLPHHRSPLADHTSPWSSSFR
jgi:hypothetical protein